MLISRRGYAWSVENFANDAQWLTMLAFPEK